MKLLKQSLLCALLGFSLNVQSGEVYSGGKACCDAKGCGSCDKTGYIFGYGGVSFTDDIEDSENFNYGVDDGFIAGGGLGVYSDFLCGSRFEIEGIYSESDIATANGVAVNGSSYALTAAMVNYLKEIPMGCVTGYLGGGIGYGQLDLNGPGLDQNDGALAYQFIAGVDLPLSECIALFTQYKLLGIGETEFPGVTLEDFISHSVSAGLRVSF